MDHRVLYTPDRRIMQVKDGSYFLEVWKGLPNLDFEVVESRNAGNGLRYNGEEGYVWVIPSAARALEKDSEAILYALTREASNLDVLRVSSVPSELSLDEVLTRARELTLEWQSEGVGESSEKDSDVLMRFPNGQ